MSDLERHFELQNYSGRGARKDDVCIAISGRGMLYLPDESHRAQTFFPLFLQGYGSWTGSTPRDSVYLGLWDGRPCYGVIFDEVEEDKAAPVRMRDAMAVLPEELVCMICMARELLFWRRDTNFCGVCGHRLQEKVNERARVCPECGYLHFPKINPAIIVAIRNGDSLLLAHNVNFAGNMYSLIAGYVECGENLEQTVLREVQEEVGIRVKNIRYWGSQPWPFPASLMFGFTADYDCGEIHADGTEIVDAGWYCRAALPVLPEPGSIARKLIEAWRRGEF